MPSYLRVTPPTLEGFARETTTGRTRRVGPPRVRGGGPADARAAVAPAGCRAIQDGREGKGPRPQGASVGQRARAGRRLDEARRREEPADRVPDLPQSCRLSRARGPDRRDRREPDAAVPRRAAASQLVHGRVPDRAGARAERRLARERGRSREPPQPGGRLQTLREGGERSRHGGRLLLGQLQEDPGRRLGMHERDAPTTGPAARHVVDEAKAPRPTALERPIEVPHAVTDVMDPRPAPGEKLRYRAVRVARLEELDLDVAEGEPDDRGAVGRFGTSRLEAEDVAVERDGGGDRRNGDTDVGDAGV